MYTGTRLIELLEQQHQARGKSGLFQKGTFTIQWRAKAGSFPHPDGETMIAAGEPCGAWTLAQGRPEDKRKVGENLEQLPVLPLNGYIPGSAIRGLVRSWAKKRPNIEPRMRELLGYQDNDNISAGKIEFLDAWPQSATQLTLDIVNPQEEFQVYHSKDKQSTPLSFYALGDGEEPIPITVAIRGIPNKANADEVAEVWGWVQEALMLYGVGSRTASGYGKILCENAPQPTLDPNYALKEFEFTLYSQGCYGADSKQPELRPSHWRGWLRSWIWRFLLGVMSEDDAKRTLGELLGTLQSSDDQKSRKGCVRLQMVPGQTWGDISENQPRFYTWKGKLVLSAPKDILNKIILPIVRIAVMVGGVGHGWRRPLHIYLMNNGKAASRGTHLLLKHQVGTENKLFGLPPKEENWQKIYEDWQIAVQAKWPNRFRPGNNPEAEVFSPTTCAVYVVPEPCQNPLARNHLEWDFTNPVETRGDGMNLIYKPEYKRKTDVGGNAAAGDNSSHCSWVSIKRINIRNQEEDTDCQEIVCLFMGGQYPNSQHLRTLFLNDLAKISGAIHLFGVQPAPAPA